MVAVELEKLGFSVGVALLLRGREEVLEGLELAAFIEEDHPLLAEVLRACDLLGADTRRSVAPCHYRLFEKPPSLPMLLENAIKRELSIVSIRSSRLEFTERGGYLSVLDVVHDPRYVPEDDVNVLALAQTRGCSL